MLISNSARFFFLVTTKILGRTFFFSLILYFSLYTHVASIFETMADTNAQQPRRASFTQTKPKALRPFITSEVKILLLENVNEAAVKAFKKEGYQVRR